MCDYSLEMYGSRPAREGEIYVTTRFPSGSIGFASAGDPRTAVCMQCDTKVMLTDIPPAFRLPEGGLGLSVMDAACSWYWSGGLRF